MKKGLYMMVKHIEGARAIYDGKLSIQQASSAEIIHLRGH